MTTTLRTATVLLLLVATGAGAQAADDSLPDPPATAPSTPDSRPTLELHAAPGPIAVDGVLDDAGWQGAAVATGFAEFQPREGVPAPIEIEAWTTYDATNLYVAFRVHEDPSTIRASLRDRDNVFGDDLVGIILDTFGNNTWGYIIGVNALGVQLDMRVTQGGSDDISFDLIYESAGRITETGYEVEMAIPFSSLSFPKAAEQSWRINFVKLHPRSTMRQYSWAALTMNNPCMLCQNAHLTGLSGMRASGRLELLPALVASQAGTLAQGGDPTSFHNDDPSASVSLGIKYPFRGGWTAEATFNPDFSQVESDAAQIDVNTTFALSYPERRPFFQEGGDLFETPISQVYTRAINSPSGAAKLIGRQGRTSVGYIGAVDERTPLLVPLEERSLFVGLDRSVSNIVRGQHAFGEASQVGLLITDRRYDGGGSGSTIGADANLRISERWRLRAQLVGSHTVESETGALSNADLTFGDGHTVALDGESFNGHASYLNLNRSGQRWSTGVTYRDVSPGYRSANGFQTRNNFRTGSAYSSWAYLPEDGLLDRAQLYLNANQTWNFDGDVRSRWLNPSLNLQLKGQTHVSLGGQHGEERFDGTLFQGLTTGRVGIQSMYSEKVTAGVHVTGGDAIWRQFGNARQGRSLGGGVSASLRPTQRLQLEPSLNYQQMHELDGTELFAGYVTRARVSYQFTRELFARAVVQYNDFSEAFSFEPLVMYRINPLSVLYLGSTHGYNSFEEPYGFTQTDRQFFLKLQYLFRP